MADDNKPQRRLKREATPGSSSAIDIAMGAAASGKGLPEIARRVLEEQADYLHAQTAELKLSHIGNSVRAVLWGVLALLALGMLLLIGAVVVRAARADALVVESFKVPPAMAAKGLSGDVVATQVLDQLAALQQKTESTRAASSYANNWGNDLKIDIPNTGATADQIWTLLRGWLGKETRISGEVIETPQGLALTARVGGKPGERFVSKTNDLDSLVGQGAKLIFKQTQAYRYAISLDETKPEGLAEATAILSRLTSDESPIERKWAYNGLSVLTRTSADIERSIVMANKALEIDPSMIPALGNLHFGQRRLGHDQQAVETLARAYAIRPGSEYDQRIVKVNNCMTRAGRGDILRDQADSRWARTCFEELGLNDYGWYAQAQLAAMRHDGGEAARLLTSAGGAHVDDPATIAETRLLVAMGADDQPAIAAALSALVIEMDRLHGKRGKAFEPELRTYYWPLEAEALTRVGRGRDAMVVANRTPLDCYACVRVRGLAAWAVGDRKAAQRWFAQAVRQGPRLPAAYLDRGRLLHEAKHYAAANADFAEAVKLSNRGWADAFRYQGDNLVALRRADEARAAYDLALKLAPKWAALRDARARVRSSVALGS